MTRSINENWIKILPIAGLVILWESLARSDLTTPFLLPQLTVILAQVWDDFITGTFFQNVMITSYRALSGFVIAAIAGTVIGIAMARVAAVRWFFDPIVSLGFPTPKIAFLPIFMLWFGMGDSSKIAMITAACFFVITAAAIAGASGVDRQLMWSAKSLGASEREILTDVILPAALPQILTGFQVALPISLIVTLVTEMIMGGGGLGGALLQASRFANSVGVFAGIIEIAILGTVLLAVVRRSRGWLLNWHSEKTGPTG